MKPLQKLKTWLYSLSVFFFATAVCFAQVVNPPLRVREDDGSPDAQPVFDVIVPAGHLLQTGTTVELYDLGTASGGSTTLSGLSDTNISALASGHILIYDGTDSWDNKTMSGDVAITSAGATTIQANSVALTTDTTGNYVASVANGTSITGGAAGSEGAALTLDVADDSIDGTELDDSITLDAATLVFNDGANTLLTITDAGTTGDLTATGTIEGATLTEGGAAVFNSGETPGGELGGTWASPTVDDTLAVTDWNLTTPTITTQFTLTAQATPLTDADGEVALDTDGWGTGFDAYEVFNGTASAYLVATTASDTPSNGQVPQFNTGGSITWETVAAGAGGATTQIQFNNAGVLDGDAGLTWDDTNKVVTITSAVDNSPINITHTETGSTTAATIAASGDTFSRFRFLYDGTMTVGPGNAARDVRLYRSDTKIFTIDDTAGAAATLAVIGEIDISNAAAGAGTLKILEDTDNGINYTTITVPALAGNVAYTLPPDDGDAGEQLQTDGSGILTWESAGGSGDSITVNTTAATDANFLDNLYMDWGLDTVAAPDDITAKFNYATTLAGNPALLVDEIVLFADASGPGFLSEGLTADTNEQLYRFPDVNGADTTSYFMLDDTSITSIDDASLEVASGVLRRAALSGDITASAGSNTTAIAAGVIVDADMANDALDADKVVGDATDDDDLDLAAGGTGQSLVDPGADGIFIWDDSDTGTEWNFAVIGSGLSFDGTTLTATGSAPTWDVIGDAAGNGSIGFGDTEQTIVSSQTTGDVSVLNIDFNQIDDAAATDNVDVLRLDLTSESGDAGDTLDGLVINFENGTANTILDSAIKIDNAETTTSTLTDAIIVLSSGVDGGVVDAIDVSAANITNAINIGANNIITGAATIASSELDRLDGLASAIIEDDAIDTTAELETIQGSVNILLETEIDASSELLALMDDETGTGVLVFGTSPTFTTGITVPADSISNSELDEAATFTWTGVHDFGGASSVEMINAASATIDEDGEFYLETDSNSINIQAGDGTTIAANQDIALPLIQSRNITLVEPDQIQTVTDHVRVLCVDTYDYPSGIKIVAIRLDADASATTTVNIEEWDQAAVSGATIATIDSIALSAATETTETTITDSDVATGAYVMADLDTANINMIGITVWFYAKD